jgi:glycosyltransferase involved in cell wall biosynthesis
LVPPGDSTALTEALAHFLSLTGRDRADLALSSQDFVRHNFSKESMCAKTLDVYRELLGSDQSCG